MIESPSVTTVPVAWPRTSTLLTYGQKVICSVNAAPESSAAWSPLVVRNEVWLATWW